MHFDNDAKMALSCAPLVPPVLKASRFKNFDGVALQELHTLVCKATSAKERCLK